LKDNLNTLQIATKSVPHLLREEQRENHVNTRQDLHSRLQGDPEFLLKITTCEEMLDYKYKPEPKQHS
jgi:hypothetical protein